VIPFQYIAQQIPLYILVTTMRQEVCLFSWHELFNTSIGEKIILAYSKNSHHLCSELGCICLFAASDIHVLPRQLHGVTRIEVCKVYD
jgi:hypothetical protein